MGLGGILRSVDRHFLPTLAEMHQRLGERDFDEAVNCAVGGFNYRGEVVLRSGRLGYFETNPSSIVDRRNRQI